MTAFRVGMKVALIKAFPSGEIQRAKAQGVALPAHGVVYTIRDTEPGSRNPFETFLRMEELNNAPHIEDGIEPSFSGRLFRPIVSRPTSIAVFQAMLTGKKAGVEA